MREEYLQCIHCDFFAIPKRKPLSPCEVCGCGGLAGASEEKIMSIYPGMIKALRLQHISGQCLLSTRYERYKHEQRILSLEEMLMLETREGEK